MRHALMRDSTFVSHVCVDVCFVELWRVYFLCVM